MKTLTWIFVILQDWKLWTLFVPPLFFEIIIMRKSVIWCTIPTPHMHPGRPRVNWRKMNKRGPIRGNVAMSLNFWVTIQFLPLPASLHPSLHSSILAFRAFSNRPAAAADTSTSRNFVLLRFENNFFKFPHNVSAVLLF